MPELKKYTIGIVIGTSTGDNVCEQFIEIESPMVPEAILAMVVREVEEMKTWNN